MMDITAHVHNIKSASLTITWTTLSGELIHWYPGANTTKLLKLANYRRAKI